MVASIIITWLISSVLLRHSTGTFRPLLFHFILSLPALHRLIFCSFTPRFLPLYSSSMLSLLLKSAPHFLPPLPTLLYLSILDPQRGQGESQWFKPFSLPLSLSDALSRNSNQLLKTLTLEFLGQKSEPSRTSWQKTRHIKNTRTAHWISFHFLQWWRF